MAVNPWVRFFPSDWLGGTRGMSALETGIYATLIMSMYEMGRPLPHDDSRLARVCGASLPQFKKVLNTLLEQGNIINTKAGLWNTRVERELNYTLEKSTAARMAANSRWERKANENSNENNTPQYAPALPLHNARNTNQKPEPLKRDTTVSLNKATQLADDFRPDVNFAHEAGFSPQEIENLVENFKDYWRAHAGANAFKRDWQATWRNWVRSPYAQKNKRGKTNERTVPSIITQSVAGQYFTHQSFASDVTGHMRALSTRHNTDETQQEANRQLPQRLSAEDEAKPC